MMLMNRDALTERHLYFWFISDHYLKKLETVTDQNKYKKKGLLRVKATLPWAMNTPFFSLIKLSQKRSGDDTYFIIGFSVCGAVDCIVFCVHFLKPVSSFLMEHEIYLLILSAAKQQIVMNA